MSKLSLLLAVCSVLAYAQETPSVAEAAKKASIEGVAVNEATKEPIRRAEINLYKQGVAGGMLPGRESAYSTLTDAAGKFRIDNIDPGNYTLMHLKAGFLSTRSNFELSARLLKRAAGDSLTGLRYSLLPQAIVTGRVVDDEGAPAQGIFVTLLRLGHYHGSNRAFGVGRQQTNDRGEFRFTDVEPGRYCLRADVERMRVMYGGAPAGPSTAPGAPRTAFVSTYHPSASAIAQAARIEVLAGQEFSGLDIALRKDKVVRVSGKVLDTDGLPVRYATVSLAPADSPLESVGSVSLLTDDKGMFFANSVPPGPYLARARKYDGSDWESAETPIAVGEAGVANVALQIQPALELEGTLVLEGFDRRDFDFSGFTVEWWYADATSAGSGGAHVEPDGTFTLPAMPPGRYTLGALPGPSGGYVKSILIGSEDANGKEVEASAIAAGGLKIVIRRDCAAVSGTVEIPEERKAAMRSPSVVLLPIDVHLRSPHRGNVAQLNQNNGYELKNLRPGDYIAFAFEEFDYESLQDPEVLAAIASKGTKITLAANESRSLNLKILPWPEPFADLLQ